MRHTAEEFDFSSLSIKDLLEARDLYHFHLMNKANVVGTAIGLYLIRSKEDWPAAIGEGVRPKRRMTEARHFYDSQVRDYSWPCVIVLVREWVKEQDFGRKGAPAPWESVPKYLHLPDGRRVPVCIVEAPPVPQSQIPASVPVGLPNTIFGGGLPVFIESQHETHRATLGCLVSDGHTLYGLTAGHACGDAGTEVKSMLRKGLKPVGVSSGRQLTRRLFSEVYPSLQLRQTWLGLDVGLIRLDDAREWSPNVYGLPPIKPMLDLYEQNLSLSWLIDRPVIARGAASGLMKGRIKALFYRYRSVGGFDYVSDFLIAPDAGQLGARPGDSGALWQLQMPGPDGKEDTRPLAERDFRPLAIEWGAQSFLETRERSIYSVATSLSNICKLLDVELVVDHNDGLSGIWGAVGHYSIGSIAIQLVTNPNLKQFLLNNYDLISIPLDDLRKTTKNSDLIASGFVPLADVPDIVWKKYPSPHINRKGDDIGVSGGRDTQSAGVTSTGPEHPNHHCDADRPFNGQATLLEACIADPSLINATQWNRYFDSFPESVDVLHRGILPFRVWQFFECMKSFASNKPEKFLAASGILAHYVGDASQPLHGSIMSDGIQDEEPNIPRLSERKDKNGQRLPAFRGEGVHSAYETNMINMAATKGWLFEQIQANLDAGHGMALVSDGREAALATLKLMRNVAITLPPRTIINTYEESFQPGSPSHNQAMWQALDKKTGVVMAMGAKTLAMLWDSAWIAGGGTNDPGRIDQATLKGFYEDPNFIRSVTIDDVEQEIMNAQPQ